VASVFATAAFWLLGAVLPKPMLSSAASLLILLCGGFVLFRYAPAAYQILFEGRRSERPGEEGSHYAIYGITLLAAGAVYQGLFGLFWIYMEQPQEILGGALSSAGRAMMALGFWLMFISPAESGPKPRLPNTIWLVVLIFLAIVLAFFLGTQIGDKSKSSSWNYGPFAYKQASVEE